MLKAEWVREGYPNSSSSSGLTRGPAMLPVYRDGNRNVLDGGRGRGAAPQTLCADAQGGAGPGKILQLFVVPGLDPGTRNVAGSSRREPNAAFCAPGESRMAGSSPAMTRGGGGE